MTRLLPRVVLISAASAVLLGLSACNSNSDASQIVGADNVSLRATITYYQSLDPTMTAQASVWTNQIATLQNDLNAARSQIQTMTVQSNAGVNPGVVGQPGQLPATADPSSFASVPTPAPLGQPPSVGNAGTPSGGGSAASSGPITSASGMVIERVVTAKGIASTDGCPVNETNTFSSADARIYVVAVVRSFRRGTTFSSKWSGAGEFNQQFDWQSDRNYQSLCIHFYIEPATLSLGAGSYNVIFGATEADGSVTESAPIAFSLQ
ncbi:MAG: hypothetical protein OHK0023_05840 [Anaerolineae bacterium]